MAATRRLVAAGLLLAAGSAAAIILGAFDVSARTPHWAATTWIVETVRDRSIQVRAAGVAVPDGLDDPARIAEGFVHYRAHCALCHGAPGVEPGIIARGMSPQPPDLRQTAGRRSSAELFWIIQNGIKMSGMPAWGDHGDAELWPVVAFVRQLPVLSEADYRALGAEADRAGTTHAVPETASPAHPHDGHAHHRH